MRRKTLGIGTFLAACVVAAAVAALVRVPIQTWAERRSDEAFRADLASHIRHVVIVVQENRSFDNLFNGFPGADTVRFARTSDGKTVPLQPVSLAAGYDLDNSLKAFVTSTHDGRMDRYDLRRARPARRAVVPLAALQYPALAYVPASEIEPYLELARQYVLADKMFQSNFDQSFAAHLYLIAGTAARSVDVPSAKPWGCDAARGTRVRLISVTGPVVSGQAFPCFGSAHDR